jgi:hypothetical protein
VWPRWRAAIVVLAAVIACPSAVFAQAGASITGTVRDGSGAVLPGVTVEASSPALIEQTRTVVTNESGQYRIEALRPGTYTVTFTLTGFNAVQREGVVLTGTFVASVNVELGVGAINETVTVTGETPVVDLQSARQQRVFSQEVLDAIPQGRTPVTAGILLPGVTVSTFGSTQDVGGTANITLTGGQLSIHGSDTDDHRQMIDGVSTANADGGGAYASGFTVNMGAAQEIALDYASGAAEQSTGGTYLNVIPREGGNSLKGSFFASYVNSSFQGSYYDAELAAKGVRTPDAIREAYDYNPSVGGPLKRDRVWFFTSARFLGNSNYVSDIYVNKNAGNPNVWNYDPDLDQPAFTNSTSKSWNVRVTWQASPRNKLSFFHDRQHLCRCSLVSFNRPPESALRITYPIEDFTTVGWTAPVTAKMLFEARGGLRRESFMQPPRPPEGDPFLQMIDVTEQGGTIPGLLYRSQGVYRFNKGFNYSASASLSYITGRHAFKTGISQVYLNKTEQFFDNNYAVSYRFNNGVPNQITQRATPWVYDVRQPADLGIFVQDRWTVSRLTVNAGMRFDLYRSTFPAQTLGPGLLVPNRNIAFEETPLLSFQDIVPRVGVSYDLFGNGRTAVKASVNQYMEGLGMQVGWSNGVLDPVSGLANTVSRAWTDGNRNYVADCDLKNPLAQDNRAAGGDFCGTVSDTNFGKPTPSTTSDPGTQRGWGNRPYQWEFSASVQQEVARRVSVNAGYFRRVLGNFTVVDDLALSPADYSPFSVTAPVDPRLPDGGDYVVGPVYDKNPDAVTRPANRVNKLASDYGTQMQHWNGVDIGLDARLGAGVTVQGGLSSGRTSRDNCEILALIPESGPLGVPYCHQDQKFLTQVKFLGTYTVPRIDVQVSSTFQSIPGPILSANRVYSNASVRDSLGRDLSGGAANVTVNLVPPGSMIGERLNLLDLRFGKVLRLMNTRTVISLDVYNTLNSNAALGENATYVDATIRGWRIPTQFAQARFAKFSFQFDF